MEKVKITQEQADAIERLKEHHRGEIERFKRNPNQFADWMLPVKDMQVDDIEKAYRGGYEIDPEFKINDWVVDETNGQIRVIAYFHSIGKSMEVRFREGGKAWINDTRHATPEEIATEKERRFFAKNGRKLWELQDHDLLMNEFDELCEVVDYDFEVRKYVIKNIKHSDGRVINQDDLDELRKYRVRYFAEDRKDI